MGASHITVSNKESVLETVLQLGAPKKRATAEGVEYVFEMNGRTFSSGSADVFLHVFVCDPALGLKGLPEETVWFSFPCLRRNTIVLARERSRFAAYNNRPFAKFSFDRPKLKGVTLLSLDVREEKVYTLRTLTLKGLAAYWDFVVGTKCKPLAAAFLRLVMFRRSPVYDALVRRIGITPVAHNYRTWLEVLKAPETDGLRLAKSLYRIVDTPTFDTYKAIDIELCGHMRDNTEARACMYNSITHTINALNAGKSVAAIASELEVLRDLEVNEGSNIYRAVLERALRRERILNVVPEFRRAPFTRRWPTFDPTVAVYASEFAAGNPFVSEERVRAVAREKNIWKEMRYVENGLPAAYPPREMSPSLLSVCDTDWDDDESEEHDRLGVYRYDGDDHVDENTDGESFDEERDDSVSDDDDTNEDDDGEEEEDDDDELYEFLYGDDDE